MMPALNFREVGRLAEAWGLAEGVARELVEGDACDPLAGFPVLAAFGHVPAPVGAVRRPDTYLPEGVCEEGGEFVAKCRGCNEWRPILCDLAEIPAEGYVHHCGGAPWCCP